MKRLQSIDVLRGIACLAVLFYHISRPNDSDHFWLNTALFFPFRLGNYGVPLFLLISGFCIHRGAARYLVAGQHSSINWSAFWRRRFWRLYPPYLAMIGLSLMVLVWFSKNPTSYDFASLSCDLVTHLLLIHNLFVNYAFGLGNGAFWTLGLEEQLYALYALYLLLRKRLPPARVLLIAACVSLVWRLLAPLILSRRIGNPPLEFGLWGSWPFGYWGLWVAGALAADAYAGAVKLPTWCYRRRVIWLCLAAGTLVSSSVRSGLIHSNWAQTTLPVIAISAVNHLVRLCDPTFFVIGFFVLINIWTRREAEGDFGFPGSGLLARLGVISYSLYLTHMPALRMLGALLPLPQNITGTLIRHLIYAPLCLLIALAFFLTIERHFLRPLQRREPHPAPREQVSVT